MDKNWPFLWLSKTISRKQGKNYNKLRAKRKHGILLAPNL
jgi:hypothetical protein